MTKAVEHDARRYELLREMGLGPMWVHRQISGFEPRAKAPSAEIQHASAITAVGEIEPAAAVAAPVVIVNSASNSLAREMNEGKPSALSAWDTAPLQAVTPAPTARSAVPTDAQIASMKWPELQAAVTACVRCPLCKTRRRTVFGTGDQRGRWLLVGEGPGRSEDQQGEPFVGPAGKLLDNMLHAIDMKRGENNYIANIVKCRPTDSGGNDRAPTAEEAAACRPYLDRQIALLQPATILALGKVAAVSLLGCDPKTAVATLRGIVHSHGAAALVVTYHPAYLLRKPQDKAKSWQDLCLLRQTAAAVSTQGD